MQFLRELTGSGTDSFTKRKSAKFKFKHLFLDGYSAGGGEAAEVAVGAEYAVAWDDQGQRVFGKRAAYRSACGGSA